MRLFESVGIVRRRGNRCGRAALAIHGLGKIGDFCEVAKFPSLVFMEDAVYQGVESTLPCRRWFLTQEQPKDLSKHCPRVFGLYNEPFFIPFFCGTAFQRRENDAQISFYNSC